MTDKAELKKEQKELKKQEKANKTKWREMAGFVAIGVVLDYFIFKPVRVVSPMLYMAFGSVVSSYICLTYMDKLTFTANSGTIIIFIFAIIISWMIGLWIGLYAGGDN